MESYSVVQVSQFSFIDVDIVSPADKLFFFKADVKTTRCLATWDDAHTCDVVVWQDFYGAGCDSGSTNVSFGVAGCNIS